MVPAVVTVITCTTSGLTVSATITAAARARPVDHPVVPRCAIGSGSHGHIADAVRGVGTVPGIDLIYDGFGALAATAFIDEVQGNQGAVLGPGRRKGGDATHLCPVHRLQPDSQRAVVTERAPNLPTGDRRADLLGGRMHHDGVARGEEVTQQERHLGDRLCDRYGTTLLLRIARGDRQW